MSQAIIDPEEVRRFAAELKRFNNEVKERTSSLMSRFSALGDSWQDQEHEKFSAEFLQMMKTMKRFIELSFGLPDKAEADAVKDLGELKKELAQITSKLSKDPPPADLVGKYHNDALGDVVVTSTPKGLVLDAGEWSSRLVLVDPKERAATVMLVDGVLKTGHLHIEEVAGKKALLLKASQSEYLFTRK